MIDDTISPEVLVSGVLRGMMTDSNFDHQVAYNLGRLQCVARLDDDQAACFRRIASSYAEAAKTMTDMLSVRDRILG